MLKIHRTERGFYAGDLTLSYPFKKVQTIPVWLLGIIAVPFPLAIMIGIHRLYFSSKTKANLSSILYNFYSGLMFLYLFVDFLKYAVGRHRPDFISRCVPQYLKVNATINQYVYPADVCSGNPVEIAEGKLSFPSGHAAITSYSSVIVILYLQFALANASEVLRSALPLFQASMLLLAFWGGASRTADNWHHATDVLAGAFMGTCAAAGVAVFTIRPLVQSDTNVYTAVNSNDVENRLIS